MSAIANFPNLPPAEQEAILQAPALKPPPGVVPNFKNTAADNAGIVAYGVICLSLVFFLIIIRFYSRLFVVRRWMAEDVVGLLGLPGYIAQAVSFFGQLHFGGFFNHQYNVHFGDFQQVVIYSVVLSVAFPICVLFVKTAILMEWRRIFCPHGTRQGAWYWVNQILVVLNILSNIAQVIAEGSSCLPIQAVWQPWTKGTCLRKQVLDLAGGYFNLVLDLLIFILPQFVIWKLHLSPSKKLGVSAIFSFGLLCLVGSAGRVYETHQIGYTHDPSHDGPNSYDLNIGISRLHTWAFAETTCAIIVFCMPAVPSVYSDSWVSMQASAFLQSMTRLATFRSRSSNSGSGHASVEIPRANDARRSGSENSMQKHASSLHKSSETQSPTENIPLKDLQGGILRQTQFTVHSETASVNATSRTNDDDAGAWA